MELLKLEGLTKVIKKKTLVDNLTLTVNSGEIVGFLGPNGAGKTTTIKMIMGIFGITSGSVKICGCDVATDFENAMSHVGAIIENPDLYKRLSGRQNLEYFASYYGKDCEKNINSIVELVKMSERINDKVAKYSLGMRQRIGVAQALLHMPKLLVLDEPTNGLDPIGIKELRELLKTLAREKEVGVFVSSHLLSEMEIMCDRIYIIDNGAVIGEQAIDRSGKSDDGVYEFTFGVSDLKSLNELFVQKQLNSSMNSEVVTLIAKQSIVSSLVREIVAKEIDIYFIDRKSRSLEDDFISMTEGTKTQIR